MLLCVVGWLWISYQGRALLANLGSYLTLNASQRMAVALKMTLLRHLNTLSADYYESTPVGTVIYPLKEPVEEIAYFGSDLLPSVLRLLLSTCFTLAAMALLSMGLTLTVVPLIPVFLIARQHFRKRLRASSDTVQQDRIAWSNFLQEHLTSAIPIQLLGQENRQERRAFQLLGRIARSQLRLSAQNICDGVLDHDRRASHRSSRVFLSVDLYTQSSEISSQCRSLRRPRHRWS